MKKEGFTQIDGLDASDEMLNIAKSKGVFQNYICARVGMDHDLPIKGGKNLIF